MWRLIVLSLLVFPGIASAQTIVSSSESSPHPGIRIVEGRTSSPAANFYAAYVSLCSDYVHVDASSYGTSRSASSWGNAVGAQLAVNGDFYTTTPRLHVYGDAVGSGQRWATNRTGVAGEYSSDWYYGNYGWIAFGDGWVDYTNSEWVKNQGLSSSGWKPADVAPAPPAGTKALVSGFPQLVVDGEPISCSSATASSCFPDRSDMRARHPRTAMGLSEDKQTFLLVVVDGRSTSSAGMYGLELANLMHALGAHTAFNLDGGGSAQMWVAGRGTINDPSDGTPRSVPNHWGVFASASSGLSAIPGSCDNSWDGLLHVMAGQVEQAPDLDGDGLGDVCIRTATGVECALAESGQFGAPIAGPALADDSGWSDPSNYATMRWGDIDGDGKADLCARANAGMRCWRFDGTAFGDAIVGPAFADADGFDAPGLYSTIRLADVTGDGMDDICARWTDGFECYPSTGDGFGEAIAGPAFTDASGWGDVSNYGTIRTGDVNGDGKDDVCARADARFLCWLTDGERIDGPEWSDAAGWTAHRHWSTIRLVDLDDDGRADVCGRSAAGLECALSTGTAFGPVIAGPALSDSSGWADYSNYSTLRFADVTGDGILDACARANDGMRCWPFDGTSFGAAIVGPAADESGWSADRFHRTLDFVDIDGDGRADMCARAARGLVCWRSLGDAFAAELVAGPTWSDEAGFGAKRYYGTMTVLGPVRPLPVEPDPDPDPQGTGGGTGGDPEVPGPPTDDPRDPTIGDGDPMGDGTPGSGDPVVLHAREGCGCAAVSADSPVGLALLALACVARRRRRAR